jgi:hypothetical protein
MDNYYKKKADKYKYKYLKLKNRIEYIGGGGDEFYVEKEFESFYNECKKKCKKDNNVYSVVYAMGIKSDNLKRCIEDCKNEVKKLRQEKFNQKLIAQKIEEEKEKEKDNEAVKKNLKKRETEEINKYNETSYDKISTIEELREKNKMSDKDIKRLENRKALRKYLDSQLNNNNLWDKT